MYSAGRETDKHTRDNPPGNAHGDKPAEVFSRKIAPGGRSL